MNIKLELDEETSSRLMSAAVQDRRPPSMEAEYLIMRALGTWKAYEIKQDEQDADGEEFIPPILNPNLVPQ